MSSDSSGPGGPPRRAARVLLTVLVTLLPLAPARAQGAQDAAERPVVTVGFVQDGPSERNGLLRLAVEEELRTLASGEFDVRFPEAARRLGDWTADGLRAQLDEALADERVDVLIALGSAASHEVARRAPLPRPVIAARLLDAERLGVLRDGKFSAVPNLCFVSVPTRGPETARAFVDVADVTHVAVVIHDLYRDMLDYLPETLAPTVDELGIELTFVWVSGGPDAILAALPEGADGVVLAPTLHLSREQSRQLADGFIARRLPSFSLLGSSDVELGHLATLSPASDMRRLVRRVALNAHRIMLGERPEDMAVSFDTTERLTFNIATARAIRVWPRFDLLVDAELVAPDPEPTGEALTIVDAVREALAMNLDLVAVERVVEAAREDVEVQRSALWPQIDALLDYTVIDRDRAAGSGGATARRTWEAGVRLQQLLYNEPVDREIDISELTYRARKWFRQEQLLDVTQATALSYLDVLRNMTLVRIRRDDVELTRSNLELAQTRRRIGVADRSEVYRWESRLATSKRDFVRTGAQLNVSEVLLKRLLNRSMGEPLELVETGLEDPLLFKGGRDLEEAIDNPWSMSVFEDWLVERAFINSPELQQLQAELEVNERVLESRRAAFWAPTASAFAQAGRRFHEGGTFAPPPGATPRDREDWTVGLSLSYPLYQGGQRSAAVSAAVERRAQAAAERAAASQRVEQNVRTSVQLAMASHTSIRLSEQAAAAAADNLELVRDSYAQGVVTIIQLLDAQNAALTARLEAAAAVYDFLIDLMDVQRAAGEFHVFLSESAQAQWEADVREALRLAGVARDNGADGPGDL